MTITETDWLLNVKQYKKCPNCKQGDLDTRVKRGRFVKSFLFWLDMKRYTCNSCGKKVYIVGKNNQAN